MDKKDIEVGMYAKIKDGSIARVLKLDSRYAGPMYYDDYDCCVIDYGTHRNAVPYKQIVNADHNIICILEVGDYVNGARVTETCYKYVIVNRLDQRVVNQQDIKFVVTKEYFDKGKFKV